MKWIFLVFFALPASAQVTYTPYQLAGPMAIPTSYITPTPGFNQLQPGNDPPTQTMATATNGSVYIGWFSFGGGPMGAAVWFSGLSKPPYVLTDLIIQSPGSAVTAFLTFGIDVNGNIVAWSGNEGQAPGAPGTYWLLVPSANPLQAQLTHVTSEMVFYRNGVVNWEAQALAWEATAKECQANKGVC
jgi:hypothetical protein